MKALRGRSAAMVALLVVAAGMAACRAELPAEPAEEAADDALTNDGGGDIQASDLQASDTQASDTAGPDSTEPDAATDAADTAPPQDTSGDVPADSDAAADTSAPEDVAQDVAPADTGGPDAADTADSGPPVDCSDGVTCTVDTLVNGVCSHTADDKACDDNNICTEDLCSLKTDCSHSNSDEPCEDGSACTTLDQCLDGTCVGKPKVCDDKQLCTDDACDPLTGCTVVPVDSACDDGNACTDDSCVPKTGCVFAANSATCTDGDACSVGDSCADKKCSGTKAICDDGVACTVDACDKTAGCTHTAAAELCDDKSECTSDSCDLQKGCQFSPVDNGTACNAGSKCTSGMACKDGACIGGKSLCPPSSKACFVSGCTEAKGCTESWAKNGASCSDGEPCTTADTCTDGSCLGGAAPDCAAVLDNKGPCWLAVCTPGKGCEAVAAAKDTPCDDKQFCTKTDLCDGAGTCKGAGLPDLCTAGKSAQCGTFDCNPLTQACTVAPVNKGLACTPEAAACAKTGVCVDSGACAPTDNSCAILYAAGTYPKEPFASGPQMARLSDSRLGLAWLHQYEAGQAGDAAYVTRQAHFATVRSDGLPSLAALVFDGKAQGSSMGSLQLLAGPDADGVAGAIVHLGLRTPGQQMCGAGGYSQTLQSKWFGINAALLPTPASSGSLPAANLCALGGPTLWMTRQVRFGPGGPIANHALFLENWTSGASTWTLVDAKGEMVWSKPATDATEMAHDLVQVGDRYVLYASGTAAAGLSLAVLDPSGGGPAIAKILKPYEAPNAALDVAIAAPSPDKTTWLAIDTKTAFDRRLHLTKIDLANLPELTGLVSTAVVNDLKGGPARPSVAGTDDGWAVAAWEDDLAVPNGSPQRVVRAGGFSFKGGIAQMRRMDISTYGAALPRVAYNGAIVISWVDTWFQNTMVTRVVPGPHGLVSKANDLPPPVLAAGSADGHQTGPVVAATSDGKLRVGWAVGAVAPIQLVERTFDAKGAPIDAAPRVLSQNAGGALRLAALADGGWVGAWPERVLDPANGALKANLWKSQVFSKSDQPGPLQQLANLAVGQPSNALVNTAVAAIPGVSAAVLLSSGSTATADTSDVLRVACLSAQGVPFGLVTIADTPNRSRASIELRHIISSAGKSQYWALWSDTDAKTYSGKKEDILLQVLDADCSPLGAPVVVAAGKEEGAKSIRMAYPQLVGTHQGATSLVWSRRDEVAFLGSTVVMAPLSADFVLGEQTTLAGAWMDPLAPVALRNAEGTTFVALRNVGLAGGSLILTIPNKAATGPAYTIGKSQFAIALAEMLSGSPLLVAAEGMAKPMLGKLDAADVYLYQLPSK